MGSGPSSQVKNIQIDQPKEKDERTSNSEKQVASMKQKEMSAPRSPKIAAKWDSGEQLEDKDEKLQTLEKQLIESESQRLDMEDLIQTLQEQLEYLSQQNLIKEEKSCDETLNAKTQYITKLEHEKSELQLELTKWKQRHKRKVKSLTAQLTEQRLEANFQLMELREETQRLLEENKKLEAQPNINNFHEPGQDGSTTASDRLKVILELSSQLEDQNKQVSKLEKQLVEKDELVKELRVKLKNNSEYLKAREGSDSARLSSKPISPGNKSDLSVKKSRKESSRDDKIDSLFAVDEEEDDFDEADSLLKLTSYLKDTSSTGDKVRASRESYELKDESERMEKDTRSVSGSSRDSGLGSAGRRDRYKHNNHADWMERSASKTSLESGLSDSDFDSREMTSHQTISSAPPKLQNGGHRLKKKSNSLKKRASEKEMIRPKPSVAFAEGSESINSQVLYPQNMSAGISPVHVN